MAPDVTTLRAADEVTTVAPVDGGGTVHDHLCWMRLRGLRESTAQQRRRALSRLARHAGVDVDHITPEQAEAFIARPMSHESRATEIAHLRGYYTWAVRKGIVGTDPTVELIRPRLRRRLPRPITDAALEHALTACPDERAVPMLWLAAYCGLRAQDMHALRMEDFTWGEPSTVHVLDAKGGDQRIQVIPAHAIEVLHDHLPTQGWAFPRMDGKPGPIPAHRVSHIANAALRKMCLPFTLHQLRHWYGTTFYRTSGYDLRATQEAMGHRSVNSTAIYTLVDRSRQAQIADALPRLTG